MSAAWRSNPKIVPETRKSLKSDSPKTKMAEIEQGPERATNKIWWLRATKKSIYILVRIMLVGILLTVIASCIRQFDRGPTYMEAELVQQHKALFPAMTVCPVSHGYKEDVLRVCWYSR